MKKTVDFLGMKLDSPLFLAPLAGVTDGAFRYLCRKNGAGLAYTEMVSAKGLYYGNSATEDLLRIQDREGPVGIQLFGHEPEIMAFAAGMLRDRPNVLIDINMGCPVNKVYRNGEGSALLKDPDLACRIVEAAAGAAGKPVTVKMRIGALPSDAEFAKRLQDSGASAITVHGRTREQFYQGKADWDAIRRVAEAVTIPVIANGDAVSAEKARELMDHTGCSFVMIGRAAMGNPFIFSGAEPSPEERRETVREHFELLCAEKGERVAIREMRKHFAWYTKGIKGASGLRQQVNTAETAEDIERLIESI